MYRMIQSAPLNLRETHLVRLIQGAMWKRSAWGDDFTATGLAARIEALSGAGVTASDMIRQLDRYGSLRGAPVHSDTGGRPLEGAAQVPLTSWSTISMRHKAVSNLVVCVCVCARVTSRRHATVHTHVLVAFSSLPP